ncbi:MAG TPA: DUF177 domain-containing protein [Thermoanaerobaculia bacterium]|nr:DUF177 domain-containing protein [Thermoanaerobaculia bacterium]
MDSVIDFETIDEHGPQTYHASFDIPASEVSREEVTNVGNVAIHATADQGDLEGEYIADGTVSFTADLECARCVEAYPFANTSAFHVRFRPRPEASVENEEVEITDKEELDVEFYSERSVPLRDLALEQIQLSIPMKPLCDENCLGLCPTCGANRMRQTCSCGETITDERWGALKSIREELAKKKEV